MIVSKKPPALSPCREACPAGIDMPRYLRYIAQGRFGDALGVIRERIPFPWVCGLVCTHPCELKCRLGDVDMPEAIRVLKRFVSEQPESYGLAPGTQAIIPLKPAESASIAVQPAARASGKRVAVVGGGPSGLTAAYYLAGLGHAVTVFEARSRPGGMMRWGIPRYRLPLAVLDAEIEGIKRAGVEIKTNARVESVDTLMQDYDAVFVAVGAQKGMRLGIPGEDSPGVMDGVSLLGDVSAGKQVKLGQRVGVIGGGNTALDAARTALRLGAKEVMVLYRRSRDEMPASPEEINEALQEGVEIVYLTGPKGIASSDGRLRLQCQRMRLGDLDRSGRPRPEPVAGSEFEMEFDTIIAAVGQQPDIPQGFGLKLAPGDTIHARKNTLLTSRQGVFAGGDAVTGPASIISAIAQGRKAAIAIDRYLGGKGNIDEILAPPEAAIEPWRWGLYIDERVKEPLRDAASRVEGFVEVEQPINSEAAVKEAKRCLRCDLAVVADTSKCVYCQTCLLRCSLRKTGTFNPSGAALKVYRLASGQIHIEFSDDCDLCGLCARYCPYGAITREKAPAAARD